MKGRKDHEAAAQEAFEEAGVTGRTHRHPMGAYTYVKRKKDGSEALRVMVYLLEVQAEAEHWPEQTKRSRAWTSASNAAGMVFEPGLADILTRLNARPDKRSAIETS
jgi:8-oxo-dGTP pyrophosphatase MutT (NUDIX family)